MHFPAWLPEIAAAAPPLWLAISVTLAGLFLGFANLLYRLTGDVAPDTRRRLRVLVAGMVAGRGPVMVLEIAGLFGIPEGTVRSELFHAKRKLRAALDGRREE